MTVSRTITITYDAPDAEVAAAFEGVLNAIVFGGDVDLADVGTLYTEGDESSLRIENQAMTSEPTSPVDPMWAASDGHR